MTRVEETVGYLGAASMPMPIVGEMIIVLGKKWRCVSISYEDNNVDLPELRVRYKLVQGVPNED